MIDPAWLLTSQHTLPLCGVGGGCVCLCVCVLTGGCSCTGFAGPVVAPVDTTPRLQRAVM